jgi:hypothetical protein
MLAMEGLCKRKASDGGFDRDAPLPCSTHLTADGGSKDMQS